MTLDLGGHTVNGVGLGTGIRTRGPADVFFETEDVTVRNGTVREFRTGVDMSYSHGSLFEDAVVEDNDFIGVLAAGVTGLTVREVLAAGNGVGMTFGSDFIEGTVVDNEVYGNGAGMGGGAIFDSFFARNDVHDNEFGGMGFTFSRDNRVTDNRVSGNGTWGIGLIDSVEGFVVEDNRVTGSGTDGILLTGEDLGSNQFIGNRSEGSGDDGLDIDGPGSTVTRNTANGNADLGIEAAPGTIDGGKNKARANGDPAQCVGVSCR